ncbi:methyltransferase domain-containing protein [Allosaccharopolyspora coralli]|uniref:Methyltransferase domain-containing protein n=1 Tax=Allosaccharopolyspora coralli TaxID=2665642 RepID=A0A5Q3Q8U9_9PSEU|nr:class I SAM-dependent methyltransferase [Allosaccharopolyspora coralli]QGK70250.1 methyltransferase domain-containing protein [Allosaccharopolyspora coralli]
MATSTKLERLRRHWDRHARTYDRQMGFMDRKLFGDTRQWLCRQAQGEVLEVAIGTGLNLDWYPPDEVRLTGVDLSPVMLDHARRRAAATGREVTLSTGNAQRLEFADGLFDTVVCTFSLCAVPDDREVVTEIKRVLRPGGRLLLADHVVSTAWPVRVLQRALELVTIPVGGENFRRRPIQHVQAAGFVIEQHARFKLGIVERLVARKPAS